MMNCGRVAKVGSVLAALLLLPCTAGAQENSASTDDATGQDIVVTGRAEEEPTRREISRQARAVTRPQNMYHEPLARFEDRLCPGIMGIKVEHAEIMVDRIRRNAEEIGITLADPEKCSPNFIVAFVTDGQQHLASLARTQGHLFSETTAVERQEILSQQGPARVWTTTSMRSRDGMPMTQRDGLVNPPTVSAWSAHSKIYLPVREDITQVLVLFDAEGVAGRSLVQLADYATIRGLARTRPVEDDPTMDTILTLFHSDTPPWTLTEFDRAYLAAIYASIPNMPGITKLLDVNRQLRRQEVAEARQAEGGEADARR